MTYSERLPSSSSGYPLITRTKWDHMTVSKIYITTITRFMVSKPGRVLTYGSRFITQTLKLSRIFCFFSSFLVLFLDELAKDIWKFFFYWCFKGVWPGSNLWISHAVAFKPCPLEIKSNDGFNRDHVESCSSST